MSSSAHPARRERRALVPDAMHPMGLADTQPVASEASSLSYLSQLGRDPWLISLVVLFLALAWVSWGRIESPIIDFGREVEIPSRLVSGQVLYRDVGTYYGPLAYYVNALLLAVFGHHLNVFFALNVVLATAEATLVYQLARRFVDSQWAALCSAYVVIYCVFCVFRPGLFNFVTPFSYGAVYANVLCLLSLYCLDRHALGRGAIWLAAAGLSCVLAAIAKPEYGAASLAGLLAGIAARSPFRFKKQVRDAFVVTAGVSACVFLVIALFAAQAGWAAVLDSLLPASKLTVLSRSSLFTVSWSKTLNEWSNSLVVFLIGSLFIVTAVFAVTGASTLFRRHTSNRFRALAEIAAAALVAWLLWILSHQLLSLAEWLGLGVPGRIVEGLQSDMAIQPLRKLSWFIPVIAIWIAVRWKRLAAEKHGPLLFGIAALALVLNARFLFYILFYGLYAAPVALLFFVALHRLASYMRARQLVQRYLAVCLVIGAAFTVARYRELDQPVRSIYGTFSTEEASVARAFNQAIETILARGSTSVLTIPEGSLLNFLTATHSPSYATTFLPPVLATPEAESEFVRGMEKRSPELIAHVQRFLVDSPPGWSFPEWGYKTYGDFNPIVDSWIKNEHRLIAVFPEAQNPIISIYSR